MSGVAHSANLVAASTVSRAVGGDQRVRHRAEPAAAPPRRLLVGRDADLRAHDLPGDVRGVAVARLHAVVVVPGRHEDHRLAVRGAQDVDRVRRDQRAAREHAEVHGLEMRERRVVALDRHHRLVRLELVAVVERVHRQLVEAVGAELEDRDRLVHAAEIRVLLLEDLHHDLRVAAVLEQRRACVVEVRVRVPAGAHLLDRQVEDARVETRARRDHDSSSRHACSAASATSSCAAVGSRVPKRCCSSWPGFASSRATGCDGLRVIQPNVSTDATTAPSPAIARAGFRSRRGARSATTFAERGREQHRADEVRAAPLVLLRPRLAVLVRADRDVLRAVVAGELAAAERERRRRDRQHRGDELARGGTQGAALDDLQRRPPSRRATRARAGAASAAPPRAAHA